MNAEDTIGPIFLGVGGLTALLALFFFWRTRRFIRDSVPTQGTVMGLQESYDSESGTTYRPVVQFITPEGQPVTFTETVGTSPPRYQPGQVVPVRYVPSNPHRARIPSRFGLWFLPAFFLLFAVSFGGVGIWQTLAGPGGSEEATAPSFPDTQTGGGVVATTVPPPPGASGSVLTVQDGSGVPSVVTATCESIRDRGRRREVRLAFDGGGLTFTADPYTGPNAYQPGANLQVKGSVFPAGASLSGAVIFDGTGRAGAVNLVAGATSVSGAWSCTNQPKP